MTNKAMKKISLVVAVLMSLVLILAPLGFILGMSFVAPSQYTNTFYGALDLKYDRLVSENHDKVVVVGGSSVAFGLDSVLMEEYLGMPVVNFGLYADLGTKLMLELSRDHIKKGDIVVIAPELDAQTLSMYFSWENTLKAFDDDMSMLTELERSVDEWLFSIEGFWSLASAKLEYMVNGATPNPTDVYNAANFNEQGDIDPEKFPRENNIMKNYYLSGENYAVDFDPKIVEAEFLNYLNEYITDCEKNGATVYFSWCPVNDLSVVDLSKEKIAAFENFFRDNLECEVISSLDDYIMDSHYFYDTNFHLNDAGVRVRTLNLLGDFAEKYDGLDKEALSLEPQPQIPDYKYSQTYDGEYDPNTVYFTYELTKTGTYKIVGLTELGKRQKILTAPRGYSAGEGSAALTITEIDVGALAGSACETLIIPADTNIGTMSGSFKVAEKLRSLKIYMPYPTELAPPSFDGTRPDFKIHVPRGSGYGENYNWASAASMGLIIDDL